MISSTCHVASHIAITGILSVCFFREEAVIRPALSGRDRKVSAGRVVVSTCVSTLILVVAAHRTAAKLLSGEIGMPSTGGNPTDTVPTAPDCLACIRYQDTPSRRSPGKSALLGPFQRPFLSLLSFHSSSPVLDSPPCDITITDLPISSSPVSDSAPDITITDLPISSTPVPESTTPCDITTIDFPIPSSPVLPSTPANITMINSLTSSTHVSPSTPSDITMIDLSTSSTQVFAPTPHNITIIDLPDLTKCNRLSLTSDTTLAARDDDDDLKDIFADEASNTKEVESSGDERTFHEVKERAPARATHGYRVDILPPSTTLTNLRPLLLVNKFRTTPSHITTDHSLPGSAHLTDVLLQTMKTANSLHDSSASLAPKDDFINLEDVFMDEALDIKDLKSSGDERTHHKDHSATTTNPIDDVPSRPPNPRPLALVDKLQTTSPAITNPSLHGSAHPTDTNTSLTGSLHPANANASLTGSNHPSNANTSLTGSAHPANANAVIGSAHPTNMLGQKTKAAASWLKPLVLVTKHATGRLIPPHPTALQYQPEKSRPHKLKQQKRKPRASRSNAACDSIVRSRLWRHTNRIVGHLAQVCEQIHTDRAAFMDVWVTAMAEVGLTSILAGNHRTSLVSPFTPIIDAVLVPEPGSRIKARLASLRQRTNAVAATIPATATTSSSLARQRTS